MVLGITSPKCNPELFATDMKGAGMNIPWYDMIVNWPNIAFLTLIGAADVNLQFTIGLRKKGSIRQTLFCLPDGSRGLHSLATATGQSSVRKLFNM